MVHEKVLNRIFRYAKEKKLVKLLEEKVLIYSEELKSIGDIFKYPETFMKSLDKAKIDGFMKNENIQQIIKGIYREKLEKVEIFKKFIDTFNNEFLKFIINSKQLSADSIKNYLKNLKTIENLSKKTFASPTIYGMLLNPHRMESLIVEYVKTNFFSNSFRNSLFASILALFLHNCSFKNENMELFEHWREIQKKYMKVITDSYIDKKISKRQEKINMTFQDIIKLRDSLEESDIRLLLFFYTEIASLRGGDLYRVSINKKDVNYIDMKLKKLIIGEFKTSKSYGKIEISLNDSIMKELTGSLKKNPRNFLFVDSKNNPYSNRNTYNKKMNAKLKKVAKNDFINLTDLRHIYLENIDLSKMSVREKENLAKAMGHSRSTQELYQLKKK